VTGALQMLQEHESLLYSDGPLSTLAGCRWRRKDGSSSGSDRAGGRSPRAHQPHRRAALLGIKQSKGWATSPGCDEAHDFVKGLGRPDTRHRHCLNTEFASRSKWRPVSRLVIVSIGTAKMIWNPSERAHAARPPPPSGERPPGDDRPSHRCYRRPGCTPREAYFARSSSATGGCRGRSVPIS